MTDIPTKEWFKQHGITSWVNLLEIAESANPPITFYTEDDWWGEVTFQAMNGWKVVIYYDGDTIAFIDSFVEPDGTVIDFWDWPEDHPWRNYLKLWSNVGDLERLKRLQNDEPE
jgi:hypothetical protein